MRSVIRKLALINAQKFKGQANPKAIIGGLVKECPKAKDDMKSTMALISEVVGQVNSLSVDEQKGALLQLDPDFEANRQHQKQLRKEQAKELPELPGAVRGKVVTRMAPEPSKYAHLGHAMSFLFNYLYAKRYDGKVILRFDDTNPEKSAQEFVDAMKEDIVGYLGLQPDEVRFASDHMDTYYAYAQRLVDEGKAYACSCPQEVMSKLRREGKPCQHREQPVEYNQRVWEEMKQGKPAEGSVVLRLKIDMAHKNAVMRDPVVYRLSYSPHYKTAQQYKVWPMYDFESAIEEGLNASTHVLRGNEFDTRIELQQYIATLFGFPQVVYKHYGRSTISGASAQGRVIREGIERGDFIGWDDPRLVTLKALKRRGIVAESYKELVKSIGFSKQATNLDFGVIAAVNRQLLDERAARYFCVRDPVVVKVSGIPDNLKEFVLSHHPAQKKGGRVLAAVSEYYIERVDNDTIPVGQVVRFMDAMHVRKVSGDVYEFVGESYDEFRAIPGRGSLIHFVPKDGREVFADVMMADARIRKLVCEPSVASLQVGSVVQFERCFFARLDRFEGEKPVFWFAHE